MTAHLRVMDRLRFGLDGLHERGGAHLADAEEPLDARLLDGP